jgi:hypothetical protein
MTNNTEVKPQPHNARTWTTMLDDIKRMVFHTFPPKKNDESIIQKNETTISKTKQPNQANRKQPS